MASTYITSSLVALKALLAKQEYSDINFCDMKAFIQACYPSLVVEQVEINDKKGTSRWVFVCSTKYSCPEGVSVKLRSTSSV